MIAPGLDFQPRKKILKVETSTDGTGSSTVDNIVMHGRDEADETGWIPIDTAPKDGSDIILANDDEIKTAHWDDVSMGDKKGWQVACEPGNFWNYYTEIKNPTHWMPLPAKPKRKYPPVKRGRGLNGMKVYLLTYGDGSDGNEWGIISIHATKDSAWEKRSLKGWNVSVNGRGYDMGWEIEERDVEGVSSTHETVEGVLNE